MKIWAIENGWMIEYETYEGKIHPHDMMLYQMIPTGSRQKAFTYHVESEKDEAYKQLLEFITQKLGMQYNYKPTTMLEISFKRISAEEIIARRERENPTRS